MSAPAIIHSPREQWLLKRRSIITASDIPAILHCDAHGRVAGDVYAEKLGLVETPESWPLIYGSALQDGVGRAYSHHTGRAVRMASLEVPEITIHPDFDWIGATLDGTQDGCERAPAPAAGDGVLEIKVSSVAHTWDEDELPVGFQIQAQVQMACAKKAWGSVAAFVSLRQPPRYQDATFDAELFALLLRPLEEFLTRVRRREPPIDTPSWFSHEAIRRIWSTNNGTAIALDTPEDAETVKEWLEAKERKAAAAAVEDELGDRLRLRLHGAAFGLLSDGAAVVLSNVKETFVAAHKKAAHTRLLFRRPKGR